LHVYLPNCFLFNLIFYFSCAKQIAVREMSCYGRFAPWLVNVNGRYQTPCIIPETQTKARPTTRFGGLPEKNRSTILTAPWKQGKDSSAIK
jgi:hypothetical protein